MLRVSTSMTSVDLSSTQLCGLYKTYHSNGWGYGTFKSMEGTYDVTGVKAIADALSVSSSMKSLK